MARRNILLAVCVAAFLIPGAVRAESRPDPKQELQRQIETQLPRGWTLRVSWRGTALVAFISPPVSESFELLYQPERQLGMLRDICKRITPATWGMAGGENSIALEPVISGKGATSMRVDCKNAQPLR